MKKRIRKFQKLLRKNRHFRKLMFILLCVIVALIIIFIGAGIFKKLSSKTLTISINSEPETLDPAYSSCADYETLNACLFEGLMKNDENGNPKEAGCSSYAVSADGLVYTFYISKDAYWSNGLKVTSADYAYAWGRAADASRNPQYAYLFDNIALVEKFVDNDGKVIDKDETTTKKEEETAEQTSEEEQTFELETTYVLNLNSKSEDVLVVTLKKPDSTFLNKCAMGVFSPVCKSVVEKETRIWGFTPDIFVSNGAYTLSGWTNGSNIILEKNDKYYDVSKKSPKSIKVYFADEEDDAFSLFKNKTVLYSSCVSGEKIESFKNENEFYMNDDYGTYYICFNQSIEPFNDPDVRKALSLAINREKIISSIDGLCANAANSILSPAFVDASNNSIFENIENKTDVSKKRMKENISLAKELLSKAGYPDGEGFPQFEYSFNDNEIHEKIAQMIAKMWEDELNIKCSVKKLNFDTFMSNRSHHNFDAVRGGGVSLYNDATALFENLISENNYFFYNNKRIDALVKKMSKTPDLTQRSLLFVETEKIIAKDDAVCPIYWYSNAYLASKRLKNFYVLPNGVAYFDKVYIR